MTQPADFRAALRRGRRVGTPHAVLHIVDRGSGGATRFGFIVTKAVGGAVTRNLVRRRLRSLCREMLPFIRGGSDVVIRALPGSDQVGWVTLHDQIVDGVGRGITRT